MIPGILITLPIRTRSPNGGNPGSRWAPGHHPPRLPRPLARDPSRHPMIVSLHAVERFRERWRPHLTLEQAHAELEQLAGVATPTRRRTLKGDAQRWLAISAHGETITFAVRDGCLLTVLPAQGEAANLMAIHADEDAAAESEADRLACRRMLVADRPPTPTERSQRRNAERTLERAAKGERITPRAQMRARITLERWRQKFGEGA